MTKEEIRRFICNTKVYVNGKSREIQEKLFSFGFVWVGDKEPKVGNTNKPFLYMSENGYITCSSDMSYFKGYKYREVYVDEILSLEVTEPYYRPFKTKEECWEEMLKHQPFGWIKSKYDGAFYLIGAVQYVNGIEDVMITLTTDEKLGYSVRSIFNEYTFADGAPFGIKED